MRSSKANYWKQAYLSTSKWCRSMKIKLAIKETIKIFKTKLAEHENQSAQKDSKLGSTMANNQVEEKVHNQSNAPTEEPLGNGTSEDNIALDIDMQAEKEPYTGHTELGKASSLSQESVAKYIVDVPAIVHQDPSDTVSRSELDAARDQILDLKSSIQELKSEVKNKEKEILEKYFTSFIIN